MGKRMTPVEAAKDLGIRPQIVYGYIKHNRIHTFPNSAGKTQLVDIDEVKALAKATKHHRPKDPTTGKPIKRTAGVSKGALVSYHARRYWAPERDPSHRVVVVDEPIRGDDGQPSLFRTRKGDGQEGPLWETEEMADLIRTGKCRLEDPEKVLNVVLKAYELTGDEIRFETLKVWIEANYPKTHVEEEEPVATA